jgi:peroxiredoxin
MSLKQQLEAFRYDFATNAAPEVLRAVRKADASLHVKGMVARAVKAGDIAPRFVLSDVDGALFSSRDLLNRGPLVISFYRGEWCPYCALELEALASIHAEITDLGATLIAVSPALPVERCGTGRKRHPFPQLTDEGSKVARKFAVAYSLAPELRPIYAQSGYRPAAKDDADPWLLPIPATYVIDMAGRVALSYLDADFTTRLEPSEIIVALKCLRDRSRPSAEFHS